MLPALQYPLPIPQVIKKIILKIIADDGIGIFDFALKQSGGSVVENSKSIPITQYGIWGTPLLSSTQYGIWGTPLLCPQSSGQVKVYGH